MLFETVLCLEGVVQNINMHERRMQNSSGIKFDLSFLKPPQSGTYRCKIIYDSDIISAEYIPYTKRIIKTLRIVNSDISYPVKSTDRAGLDALFAARGDADDILIVKNGLTTDTSIANLAFLSHGQWLTPKRPLLRGTMREKLLNDGFLIEADIKISDIDNFDGVAVMNALRGFEPLGNVKDVIRF
ncbi:MAG: aminotransferase class IV [Campylobacterales bacterium]